jgi:RIO kinase 1
MKVPESLAPLMDAGVIQQVVQPLMSGKEAACYIVVARERYCVAKVYKEAMNRSFRQRSDYTEGRKVKNSRSARALAKRSKYGSAVAEDQWRSAEAETLFRLYAAGVIVPEPIDFYEGVLLMALVTDHNGRPAPRVVDCTFTPKEALTIYEFLLTQVIKMLLNGIVHGDLSDFNVLMSETGPVIIDFPQATDPANNRNAKKLLIRDVDNLRDLFARYNPKLQNRQDGLELYTLFETNKLQLDTRLTGKVKRSNKRANTRSLLQELEAVEREARRQRGELPEFEEVERNAPQQRKAPQQRNAPQQRKVEQRRSELPEKKDLDDLGGFLFVED